MKLVYSFISFLFITITPVLAEDNPPYANWPAVMTVTCDNLTVSKRVQVTEEGPEQGHAFSIDGKMVFFGILKKGDEFNYSEVRLLNSENEWITVKQPSPGDSAQVEAHALAVHRGPTPIRISECNREALSQSLKRISGQM